MKNGYVVLKDGVYGYEEVVRVFLVKDSAQRMVEWHNSAVERERTNQRYTFRMLEVPLNEL